jgi:hypothetical protein
MCHVSFDRADKCWMACRIRIFNSKLEKWMKRNKKPSSIFHSISFSFVRRKKYCLNDLYNECQSWDQYKWHSTCTFSGQSFYQPGSKYPFSSALPSIHHCMVVRQVKRSTNICCTEHRIMPPYTFNSPPSNVITKSVQKFLIANVRTWTCIKCPKISRGNKTARLDIDRVKLFYWILVLLYK